MNGKISITLERWRGERRLVAQKVLFEAQADALPDLFKSMQAALDAEEKVPYTFTKSSVPDSVRQKLGI